MRISVSIPVYDGKIPARLASCLLAETLYALERGHELRVTFLPSCASIAIGRNQLASLFLASDSDRLVFLDSDVTFEPGAIVRIATHPVDFVGGAYRVKADIEQYPVAPLSHDVPAGPGYLVEVASVPTGFLSLSRNVFELLKAKHPNRAYSQQGTPSHAFFQMPFVDGGLYTEDAFFCREYREAGGKVYLDPELRLTHWGESKAYTGHIGNFIRSYHSKEKTA